MKVYTHFGMAALGALVFATTAFAQDVDDPTVTDDQTIVDSSAGPDSSSLDVSGDETTGDETTDDETTGDETTGDETTDQDDFDVKVTLVDVDPPIYVICDFLPDDPILQSLGGPEVQRGPIAYSLGSPDLNTPQTTRVVARASQRNAALQLPQATPESFAEFCARPGLLQTMFCPIS